MKFYTYQINNLLEHISKGTIKSLLLYGPDKGYIYKICNQIKEKINLFQTVFEYPELSPSSLRILLNSQNFFSQKELIKIQSVGTSLNKEFKDILNEKYLHFPIFIADELSSIASIKKFFESATNFASIGCYYNDEQQIEKIILHQCTTAQKNITPEAVAHLKAHLKGDSQLICSEIEKIIYFAYDKAEIRLEDVKNVISDDMIASGDELCIYFSNKNYTNFLHEIALLKEQNINEVLMIRALIRYYLNLYIVLLKINGGCSIDNAIKSLTPPIFYKYVNDFKKIAQNISFNEVIKILSNLQQAEIEFKLRPKGFDLYNLIKI